MYKYLTRNMEDVEARRKIEQKGGYVCDMREYDKCGGQLKRRLRWRIR
jgi:hypothetical protein